MGFVVLRYSHPASGIPFAPEHESRTLIWFTHKRKLERVKRPLLLQSVHQVIYKCLHLFCAGLITTGQRDGRIAIFCLGSSLSKPIIPVSICFSFCNRLHKLRRLLQLTQTFCPKKYLPPASKPPRLPARSLASLRRRQAFFGDPIWGYVLSQKYSNVKEL